jgi:hypothetical protein
VEAVGGDENHLRISDTLRIPEEIHIRIRLLRRDILKRHKLKVFAYDIIGEP